MGLIIIFLLFIFSSPSLSSVIIRPSLRLYFCIASKSPSISLFLVIGLSKFRQTWIASVIFNPFFIIKSHSFLPRW
ncbi:hypothetical protein A3K73_05110 [Candidatus Pacearchaeota archaeon RBG_13_36_9]|nr:MAG: hypothetical protein A3K73_05110 [Candidatus Pacearchaeota archaeon RBG_13_36_9]